MTVESDRTDDGRPVPFTDDVTARIPVQPRPAAGRHQAPTTYPLAPAGPAGPPPHGWAPGPQQLAPPVQPLVAPHTSRDIWPIFAGVLSTVIALALVIGAVAANSASDVAPTASAVPAGAAPTAAPAASAAPVPETTAAPVPAAPVAPKTYTGKGDDVIAIEKPASVAIMTFSCPKCTSNTVVKSDGGEGLLVNEIGAYTGKRWLDINDGSTTTQLTIKAKGSWTVTIGDLEQARKASGPVSGTGDDVVLLSGGTTTAAVTNRGESNFAVHVLSTTDLDLAVNEIGSYDGTVPMSAPALVQVTSDGDWSITPE